MRRHAHFSLILASAVATCAVSASLARAQGERKTGQASGTPRRSPSQAAAPSPAEVRKMQLRMEQLLQLWEKQSAKLRTLDVTIDRLDRSPAWDEDERYLGRAILKSPNFAWLNFDKVVYDNAKKQKVRVAHEQIRCTGAEVWQYRSDTRQIFIYPLGKEERQRALEEGPLPFLFNMRAAEVKERYQMQLLKEDEKSYVIGVLPLKKIDQESFSKAFLQLDREYLLPTRIFLYAPDGKSTKDFTLSAIKPNASVAEENFRGLIPPKGGWTVHRDAGDGARPQPSSPRGRVNPRLPALRGGEGSGRR